MSNLKKIALMLGVFYVLLTVACVCLGVHQTAIEAVLPPFEFSSFWASWLIAFVKAFPAVTFVAVIFGYTYTFAAITGENKPTVNYSQFFAQVIKQVCLIALIFCAVNFVFREVLCPKAEFTKTSNIVHSQEYRSYTTGMQSANINGDDALTLDFLNKMLVISDYDKSLLELHEKLSARIKIKKASTSDNAPANESLPLLGESLTFKDALHRAEDAFYTENWFSAHYYSTLAIKLSSNSNPDKNRALKIAADAWNAITKQQTSLKTREEHSLYAEKLRGHGALQADDFLQAYYIFLSLRDKLPNDPDIEKYLTLSLHGLQSISFFTSEMTELVFRGKTDSFNSGFCDFFLLKTEGGGTQVVFFDKIAHKANRRNEVLYIKNLEIMQFSSYGTLTYHVRAPYAKLIPCNTSADQSENWQTIAIMNVVHPSQSNVGFMPQIITGEMPFTNAGISVLNISMKDLLLLLGKDTPISKTPLSILLNLYGKIDQYGFSKTELLSELIFRVSLPLFFMLLTFVAVWCSWKFRIKNHRRFKKRYFCFAPIFFAVLFMFTHFFEHEYRCLIYTVSPELGIYTAIIVFALIVLLLAGIVLSLSCQRDTEVA